VNRRSRVPNARRLELQRCVKIIVHHLPSASNWDTHLHPPHSNSSVYLTTTAYVRRTERITNKNPQWADNPKRLLVFIPDTGTHTPEWPSQEEPGSGLTASAPVSDVSAPVCTNGLWAHLRPMSVSQNKPSTMLFSNVQSIDLLMNCTAWRCWTMRLSNGCSTSAPRSSAAKQWSKELAQWKKKIFVVRNFQAKLLYDTSACQQCCAAGSLCCNFKEWGYCRLFFLLVNYLHFPDELRAAIHDLKYAEQQLDVDLYFNGVFVRNSGVRELIGTVNENQHRVSSS